MTRRSLVAALLVLGGLAAAPSGAAGQRSDYPTFVFATVAVEDIRGSMAVVQRTRRRSGDVFVSLHGLLPDTGYRAIASKAACGRSATGANQVMDLMGTESTGPGEDDLFVANTGPLRSRLATAKSIRLLEEAEDGSFRQVACARANRVR